MPLPIPAILENASNVLVEAKKIADGDRLELSNLKEALKKVSPDDLLAVLNEVGKVYVGMHNIQVQNIGSRPDPARKILEVAIVIDFGLGQRTLIVPLPLAVAEDLVRNFNDNLLTVKVSSGSLITDVQ